MIVSLLFALLAQAAFTVPGFELVVTIPVETKLAVDDIRGPTDVWVEMINGAKKSLAFGEMYAVSKAGEPLEEVIAAMERAGERGVKTRFMVEEAMMRASTPETLERLKKIKGLELRIFKFGSISPGGITHAKYFVVDDGEKAYVGSQNFDWRSLKHIHETGLAITDKKIAGQMFAIFNHDWKAAELVAKGKKVPAAEKKAKPITPADRAFLVAGPNAQNPRGIADAEAELPRLISEAKEEIRIQLLDYYPLSRDHSLYPVIDTAIRAANARKVKVKLLVSHWNTAEPGIHYLKSLAVLPGIEVRIMTIPQAKEGKIPFARVNHSKFMEIDGRIAWVGTSNWTGGYLDKTRSLEVVVKDDALAGRLNQMHEQMWASEYSAPVDANKTYAKPDKGE